MTIYAHASLERSARPPANSMWAKAPQDEQLAQRATDLAETTHLLGEKLSETTRREILTGRPVWLRLAS
ncbi:hypothetical protein [Microtetraspora sp. AC03309]|uniref:hypothetical protein n=1 Tax=Microtetraspora sp. AC03309 TaxID=2779376 RepID=UPI001E3256E0|nr:hypothetical protein [Microtetraspora sp. AC03309]